MATSCTSPMKARRAQAELQRVRLTPRGRLISIPGSTVRFRPRQSRRIRVNSTGENLVGVEGVPATQARSASAASWSALTGRLSPRRLAVPASRAGPWSTNFCRRTFTPVRVPTPPPAGYWQRPPHSRSAADGIPELDRRIPYADGRQIHAGSRSPRR